MIEEVFGAIRSLSGVMTIDYMENYDMDVAARLVAGVDIWLNTPLPPLEASGTSGMKAAYNGVLNFSVLDGWWIEGCVEGVTGWAIGPSPDCCPGASRLPVLFLIVERNERKEARCRSWKKRSLWPPGVMHRWSSGSRPVNASRVFRAGTTWSPD